MLKSTARTRVSRVRIFIANSTFSGLLEPPMSRKFAGFPPWNWIRSMVAIASPAPFTTQPIDPSSFTYESPRSRASISSGSSAERSRIAARSG